MATQKDRKANGYTTPVTCVAPALLRKYGLDQYILPTYNDWQDYRDSQRSKWKDGSQLKRAESFYKKCGCDACIKRLQWNNKIRRMNKIREAKKLKGNVYV